MCATLEVRKRCLVGSNHSGARARFDRHIADRHSAFHRQFPNRAAPVFQDITLSTTGTNLCNDRKDNVLCRDTVSQVTIDRDCHGLERGERKRLGGEDVLDLRRADSERHRPERAVRRGVAVATHDGDSGHRQPELRPDNVNDSLLDVTEGVQANTEFFGVRSKRIDLCS